MKIRGLYIAIVATLLGGAVPAQAEPAGRIAVFTGLDKITARITRLEAPVGEHIRFGSLELVANNCAKRPPEETPETTAFVEVYEIGRTLADELKAQEGTNEPFVAREPERIFSGWMFASSPGLNAVEHPVYDVWLIDCKTIEPEAPAASE